MTNQERILGNQEILERLRMIPALKAFDDEELQELLKMSEIRDYEPGEMILEEGKTDGWIFYLVSGKVVISKKGKQLVTLETTGDVFGEMGAINGTVRSASVHAHGSAMCLALNISDIDKFSAKNRFAFRYIIYREFAQILANRLRETTDELIKAKEEIERLNIVNRLVSVTEELAKAQREIESLKKDKKVDES